MGPTLESNPESVDALLVLGLACSCGLGFLEPGLRKAKALLRI